MATSMYAWTVIKNGDKVIAAGEKVSKGDFSEEDWDQLVEARSVREAKYPDMPADYPGSPRDFVVSEHAKQLESVEDVLTDDDVAVEANNVGEEETG